MLVRTLIKVLFVILRNYIFFNKSFDNSEPETKTTSTMINDIIIKHSFTHNLVKIEFTSIYFSHIAYAF